MRLLLDGHMLGQQETGIERYWSNLFRHLQRQRHTRQDLELHGYSNLPEGALHGFEDVSFYTPVSKHGLYRLMVGFNAAVRRLQPDLIHVSNFAPLLKTVPTVTTVHDLCFKNFPKTFSYQSLLAFKFFFKRSLDLSDAIICISNKVKRDLLASYSVDPEKISMVYYGVDPSFQFLEDRKLVRDSISKKFQISPNYFLVVGNIVKRKSPFPIISAFKQLLNQHKDVQLVFAGSNKIGAALIEACGDLISDRNVVLLDYIMDADDLNLIYNGALALVFNSLDEGFGLPVAEAMRCKTPVICSDIEVFREVANDAAIYVKNEKDFFTAMQRILENKDFRTKYALSGYDRSHLYSWDLTAQRTLAVYEKVLDRAKCSTLHGVS